VFHFEIQCGQRSRRGRSDFRGAADFKHAGIGPPEPVDAPSRVGQAGVDRCRHRCLRQLDIERAVQTFAAVQSRPQLEVRALKRSVRSQHRLGFDAGRRDGAVGAVVADLAKREIGARVEMRGHARIDRDLAQIKRAARERNGRRLGELDRAAARTQRHARCAEREAAGAQRLPAQRGRRPISRDAPVERAIEAPHGNSLALV
jgi:hypothetical protein